MKRTSRDSKWFLIENERSETVSIDRYTGVADTRQTYYTHRITHDIFRNHFACVSKNRCAAQTGFLSDFSFSFFEFQPLFSLLRRHNFWFFIVHSTEFTTHSNTYSFKLNCNFVKMIFSDIGRKRQNTSNFSNMIIVLWIASLEIHSWRRCGVKTVRSIFVIPIGTTGTIAIATAAAATIMPFPDKMPSNVFTTVASSNWTNRNRTRSRCYFSNANIAATAGGGATTTPRMRRFTAGSYENSFTWWGALRLMDVSNENIFIGREIAMQRCVWRWLGCDCGWCGTAHDTRAMRMICRIVGARQSFRGRTFAIQLSVFNGTHHRRRQTSARDIHFANWFRGHDFLVGVHSRVTGVHMLCITGWRRLVARFDVMSNVHTNVGRQWQIGWARRWLRRRTQFHIDAWTLLVRFTLAFFLQALLECIHIDGKCSAICFVHVDSTGSFGRWWFLARRPNLLVIRHFIPQSLVRCRRGLLNGRGRGRPRRWWRFGRLRIASGPTNYTNPIDGRLILFRIHITNSITLTPAKRLHCLRIEKSRNSPLHTNVSKYFP